MTSITLDDGTSLVAHVRHETLTRAIGSGQGRVGLKDVATGQWRWVDIARIRAIDGRALNAA